ncbi:uncharacterized protein LOC6729405 [Drosophila simulans]|uniref:GD21097 n=1 Tax=Drosophila simulans TaxID=7240 RepID=B4QT59_DROSI|nr:uncharacterized protein LOC6729405 [Drosophila simulans]EDX14223.1 GD21097 [Drosophila simulans]KMZ05557.1 uncharacterized protein Dsimw501_GD21097 [Drosophila simulans]
MLRAKIFILLVLYAAFGPSLEAYQGKSKKTELKDVVPRVFSRRRRAVLFPPGSFVKFTCSFATGLLATYPKGITFVLEEAVYFPIPGAVEDIYPKKLRPKTTTKKPEKLPDSIIYIPGTDWRFKAQTLTKPKWRQPAPKTHRIDDDSYANPYKWQDWNQKQKWDTYQWKGGDLNKAKWSKWTTPSPKWESKWNQNKYSGAWQSQHYHGHRDRRSLFDRFAKLSSLIGIDVKSCILRTICDSKRLLLPPGYSMLQDMLRVVFTLPRLDGLEDEYSRLMDKDADECATELKSKCNMNLLIWLLSGRLE